MAGIEIPRDWRGKPIKGAIDRALQKESPEPKTEEQKVIVPAGNIEINKGDYLILEERTHGNYSYPDLLVSMELTHHNKIWADAWNELKKENALMLTPRQYVDFLNLLSSGKAYDGNGMKVDSSKLDSVLDNIIAVRNPVRGEHLDAKFSKVNVGKQYLVLPKHEWRIDYHVLENGVIKEVSEELEDCLRTNKTPGIDLRGWLSSANNQGLPPSDVSDGKLYYWAPSDGAVAGFGADSDGAFLGFGGNPTGRRDWLGVRQARQKI